MRRHRFRSATATARLASFWPMMKRSTGHDFTGSQVGHDLSFILAKISGVRGRAPAQLSIRRSGFHWCTRRHSRRSPSPCGHASASTGFSRPRAAASAKFPPEPIAASICSLQHVAGAGHDIDLIAISDDQHRLEIAQILVGPPVLRRPTQARCNWSLRFQLLLQPLQQGERIGGRACKAHHHVAPARRQAADLRAPPFITVCPTPPARRPRPPPCRRAAPRGSSCRASRGSFRPP